MFKTSVLFYGGKYTFAGGASCFAVYQQPSGFGGIAIKSMFEERVLNSILYDLYDLYDLHDLHDLHDCCQLDKITRKRIAWLVVMFWNNTQVNTNTQMTRH